MAESVCMVKVYHDRKPSFGWAEEPPPWPDRYQHVATVLTPPCEPMNAAEVAWQRTQHLSRDWCQNDDVIARVRSRSSSVGDVMVVTVYDEDQEPEEWTRRIYRCARAGWTDITGGESNG